MKYTLLLSALLVAYAPLGAKPIISDTVQQVARGAEEGLQAFADAGKEVIRTVAPEPTLSDKINDCISSCSTFLQKQVTSWGNYISTNTPNEVTDQVKNISNYIATNTPQGVKDQVNNATAWISQNPEKTAAIGAGILGTYILVKWLRKPAIIKPFAPKAETKALDLESAKVAIDCALTELSALKTADLAIINKNLAIIETNYTVFSPKKNFRALQETLKALKGQMVAMEIEKAANVNTKFRKLLRIATNLMFEMIG